jgi:hypothetical protein
MDHALRTRFSDLDPWAVVAWAVVIVVISIVLGD